MECLFVGCRGVRIFFAAAEQSTQGGVACELECRLRIAVLRDNTYRLGEDLSHESMTYRMCGRVGEVLHFHLMLFEEVGAPHCAEDHHRLVHRSL